MIKGKEKEAKKLYEDAAELYGMFWMLNANSKEKIKLKLKNLLKFKNDIYIFGKLVLDF